MRLVRSQLLAGAGLLMMAVVAAALLSGSITLQAAATRAAIGAGVLVVIDRFVLPLFAMIATPREPEAAGTNDTTPQLDAGSLGTPPA